MTVFSEDSFDTKDWINKTFKTEEARENKDVRYLTFGQEFFCIILLKPV